MSDFVLRRHFTRTYDGTNAVTLSKDDLVEFGYPDPSQITFSDMKDIWEQIDFIQYNVEEDFDSIGDEEAYDFEIEEQGN